MDQLQQRRIVQDLQSWAVLVVGFPAGGILAIVAYRLFEDLSPYRPHEAVVAFLVAATSVLLLWNTISLAAAYAAACASLPHLIRRCCVVFVQHLGNGRSREMIRRGLGLSVGISMACGSAFPAFALSADPDTSTAPHQGASETVPAADDLLWGSDASGEHVPADDVQGEGIAQGLGEPPANTQSTGSDDGKENTDTPQVYTVHAGDSLWTIASSHLGAEATPEAITEMWQHIYTLNQHTIGANPHLIFPGQVLTLPKEPS
ncbi:LysM peptidoglycan-binding domain-containing protein [Schaalia suimastitidis]|uniref:LysM peptidoglycan-binding domain-containing protein n=1 Tax=Schaalia suimastitidis TaxID=121163 RepID=UPI0003F7AE05|nr:LysM peptidoglycan-binding domain-containing protein [Schaalia suimastitidis]